MEYIDYISNITSIESKYIILIIKTIIIMLILNIIKMLGTRVLKKMQDNKKEYIYTQKFRFIISILKIFIFLLIWSNYLSKFVTLISFISAGVTIAIRDLIFNFFAGIYIKVKKPFIIEDRIEINNYKGDVININTLSFELLEVNNESFIGQSTGVITHIPNSTIFSYPLRNYNTAFKYIWSEISVKVSLNSDVNKAKKVLYKIVNSNEIIKKIPAKIKRQITNVSTDYRIYYNKYEPTIYTQVVDTHIELTIRYLIHPKKARYVNSTIWNNILQAYHNQEIELYND